MRKIRCFISYCHDDVDRRSLNLFISSLEERFFDNAEVIYDESLRYGDQISIFMDEIKTCNAILVILTPSYKKKVDERQKSGVYREFCDILSIIDEDRNHNSISSIVFIPVLFSGSMATSCPDDLKDHKYADFSHFRAIGEPAHLRLPTYAKQYGYDLMLDTIVGQIQAHFTQTDPNFRQRYENFLDDLFNQKKHEKLNSSVEMSDEEKKHIIVKTKPYRRVVNQYSYILTGRKGSGKSTIVDFIFISNSKKYKRAININVDKFNINILYHILKAPQIGSDSEYVFKRSKLFRFIWNVFIYSCCIDVIIDEHKSGNLSEYQIKYIDDLVVFIESVSGMPIDKYILHSPSERIPPLFNWSCNEVILSLEKVILRSRTEKESKFFYDISLYSGENFIIKDVLSENVIESFFSILALCKKRFIVSLDGFDTQFEKFRNETIYDIKADHESINRTNFEIEFLSSVMELVVNIKDSPKDNALNSILDFCIMVPQDRFLQIKSRDRDAYRYDPRNQELRWSGPELAIMLRKRLEVLSGFYSKKNTAVFQRLEIVMGKYFPDIPRTTRSSVGTNDRVLPIFIDVLRHTFWRPRDILYYFARIISVFEGPKRQLRSDVQNKISPHIVRKCIVDVTRQIIRDEFIGEFKNVCNNIEEIIKKFKHKKVTMEPHEITDILESTQFNFLSDSIQLNSFHKKLHFLCEIGFIGIRLSDNRMKQYLYNDNIKSHDTRIKDCFVFNEVETLSSILDSEDFSGCSFIIHPIFYEYLYIDTTDGPFVLDFTYDYLRDNE